MLDLTDIKNKCVGLKETTKAVEEDKAKIVYLAKDAEKEVITPLEEKCKSQNISIEYVEKMEELGRACGIKRGASSAAILK